MFGLLRLAFTLAIVVAIVGFFLGWFSFTRTPPDPRTNKMDINVSVDRGKMGNDLQHFEQKVNQGIQGLQTPPPPGGNPPAGQRNGAPGFSLGPINIQPSGQSNGPPPGQSGMPGISFGPITLQPNAQGYAPPAAQPQYPAPQNPAPQYPAPQYPAPDNQYQAPLDLPPPGSR